MMLKSNEKGKSMTKAWSAAVVVLILVFSVAAGDVAVLGNVKGQHIDEFDSALSDFGMKADRYHDAPAELEAFNKALDGYSLVFSAPLFAFPKKSELDIAPLKAWVERGGLLVVTDGSYPGVRETFDPIVPGAVALVKGTCTSNPWSVKGYVENEKPTHPLREFPNRATNGDTWAHFEEPVGEGWQVLTRCSEGKPVVLFKSVGRGGVFLTVLRVGSTKEVENFLAYTALKRAGLDLKSFDLTPLKPGLGHLSAKLVGGASAGGSFVYSVEQEGRPTVLAEVPVTNDTVAADFRVSLRGPCRSTLIYRKDGENFRLFAREHDLPPLMRIGPSAYRGILSTGRRVASVQFPVWFAPDDENLAGATLLLEAFSGTNRIARASYKVSDPVPEQAWYAVNFGESWRMKAGEYRVQATLDKPAVGEAAAVRATSETPLTVLAARPAQCVIDEDRTFLVNGKPFFPLGIYHISPGFYERASEIGFNMVQFWAWSFGTDAYGASWGHHKAIGCGLRYLLEPNHTGENALRGCVSQVKDHPGMLMYYVADEPAENAEKGLRARNDFWHNADIHHPTYVASCRPDLYTYHASFADVFAIDPYCGEDIFAERCRRAQMEVGQHKPVVVVPWADMDADLIVQEAWTALAHDARGLIWYCWNQVGGGPKGEGIHDKPEKQAVYQKLLAQIKSMMNALVHASRRPFEQGPVHGILLGASPWGAHGLILVNTSNETVNFKMTFKELTDTKGKTVKVVTADKVDSGEKDKAGNPIFTEPTRVIENGLVELTLAPNESLAWKW